MKIILASFEILYMDDGPEILKKIELAGRTCYKSEDKITDNSAEEFCRRIIKSGHESVLEHANATVKIICDRGVSHELVRHRVASYSQESTRYCKYTEDEDGITFIKPYFFEGCLHRRAMWESAMAIVGYFYKELLLSGATPQEARSVLPNSLKTEIVITANMREWRHIFWLRCDKAAHPQMREIMLPLMNEFYNRVPILFEDIYQYALMNGWFNQYKGKIK